jgi:chemotaxis protein methyltransferase CheR
MVLVYAMPEHPVSVEIGEHDLCELRLVLECQTGVRFDTTNQILAPKLADLLRARRIAGIGILLERLRSSDEECEALADSMLNGETGFFRHPAAFEALSRVVLPDLEARKRQDSPRSLRILSAGCATGEEPYSIALSMCEVLNGSGSGWNVHIVAGDIRRRALEAAERGLYPQSALGHVPGHLVHAYFAKVGDHLLAKPRLRNLLRFSRMNLAKPISLGQFDCIFCMNVLPHFSPVQRTALVQRLHLYLQPGGYLFLGQNEKLAASEAKFRSETQGGYTLYQKPAVPQQNQGCKPGSSLAGLTFRPLGP